MSVSARFDESAVTVEPGGEAMISVQILNSGSTVEEVRLEAVGPCADWTAVEPERLSLYPGASGTAVLRVRPPRAPGTPPGETTLGLRAAPTSDANEPVVAERAVTVLPFTEVAAELLPRTSNGAWRGRHRTAVDNRGNTPATVTLSARAAGERARLVLVPAELVVPPGETKLARLNAKPAKRLWRGAAVTHVFQVVVAPQPAEDRTTEQPAVLDGSYEQQAILPRWLPRALAAAMLAAGLIVGLWYSVLRPTVQSAARDALTPDTVQKAVDAASAGTSAAGGPASRTSAGAGSGATAGSGGTPAPTTGTSSGATGGSPAQGGTGPAGGSVPASARAHVNDSVGGGSKTGTAYTVGNGKSFGLTDIVVQNPQGDAGTLVVATQDGQILSLALEDFRASDYHFVTPIEVPAGGRITMSVDCREVGRPVKAPVPSQCAESLFLGGTVQPTASRPPGN